MAEPYTVRIQSSAGDHVFVSAPRMVWDEVERKHRTYVHPQTLAYFVAEIRLTDCVILGDSPGAVVTALETFTSRHVHAATLPTYVQIRDSGGTVVPEVGTISHADGWEDIEVTAFRLPADDDPAQMIARARFDIVIRGKRVFSAADVVLLEQERTTGYGQDGLPFRRLTSHVEMVAGVDAISIVSQLRETLPTGWLRVAPSSGSTGVQITYPRYPLLHVADTVSEVRQSGGAVIPPSAGSGATAATVVDTVQVDPATGLKRTTTRAEVAGADDPLGWVEDQQPGDAFGRTEHQRGSRDATGEWVSSEALSSPTVLPGDSARVTKLRRRFMVSGGAPAIDVLPMTAGVPAQIREGPHVSYRVREEIEVLALGPAQLSQIPIPSPLIGQWIEDGSGRTDSIGIRETAELPSQRLWERRVTREYAWVGYGSPLDDAEFSVLIMDQAETP